MSNRKYLRLADGYHDRSPYNPYQSSGKYSTKQSNSVSESHSERSSNVNGGTGSRNNSPRARHSNLSPRSHRVKSSYSKTKELSKRGSSSSPVDVVSHHSTSVGDRMLKVDNISTDDTFPWSQHTSSSGKTYYYNCKTEKSQWEKPKEWLEREYRIGREKKKREAKEKSEHSRDNLHPNQAISTKEKPSARECPREYSNSSKRESQGVGNIESKYEGRDRVSYLREENKRISQHSQSSYQSNSHVVKTTSANTSAVSTMVHRTDQLSARAESTVSPTGSLQDISPPVTPVTVSIHNSSPRISTTSPIITNRSPIMLAHQHSPVVQNQSPVHPQRLMVPLPHHSNSSTPPPPPPPISPHISSAQTVHTGVPQAHYPEGSFQTTPQINVLDTSLKLPENPPFNGIPVLTQNQLHPLQQATLLQAQFQSSSVRPMTSGPLSASPPGPLQPHFQPIKQSNSTPGSPLSFNARLYPSASSSLQLPSVSSPKPSLAYQAPQALNIQDFAPNFNRGLISHTLGWPSEPVEKQAQRSSDDTLGLCFANNRLKADLIPLNFHHNLTRMRMGVGAKRIQFLREQTRKLETSDSIS